MQFYLFNQNLNACFKFKRSLEEGLFGSRRTWPSRPFSCSNGDPHMSCHSFFPPVLTLPIMQKWDTADESLSMIFTLLLKLNSINSNFLIAKSFSFCQQDFKLILNSEVQGVPTVGFIWVRLKILVLSHAEFHHTMSNSSLTKCCNLALHTEIIIPAGWENLM